MPYHPTHPIKDGKKKCLKCGGIFPVSAFPKQRQNKEGVRPDCKSCNNQKNKDYYRRNVEIIKERQRISNKTEHRRAYARKYQAERFRKEREKLASRPRPDHCEICGKKGKVCFDHCHTTGVFRGWLCTQCNTVLGVSKDNTTFLHSLIEYLNGEANGKQGEEGFRRVQTWNITEWL